jgi:hypothetical protein
MDLNQQQQNASEGNILNARFSILAATSNEGRVRETIRDSICGEIIHAKKLYHVTLTYTMGGHLSIVLRKNILTSGDNIARWCIEQLPPEYNSFAVTLIEHSEAERTIQFKNRTWIFTCVP